MLVSITSLPTVGRQGVDKLCITRVLITYIMLNGMGCITNHCITYNGFYIYINISDTMSSLKGSVGPRNTLTYTNNT